MKRTISVILTALILMSCFSLMISAADKAPCVNCQYGDYKSYKNPTCTEDEIREYICVVCREAKLITKTGTALGHAWGSEKTVAANCTKDGKVFRKCTRDGCGAETLEETIPALGHTLSGYGEYMIDNKSVQLCETCGVIVGCSCACHLKDSDNVVGKIQYFIFIIMAWFTNEQVCECGALHYSYA